MILRPARIWRIFGWALAVFGVVFGLSGFAAGSGDLGAVISLAGFGIVCVVFALGLVTAAAKASRRGVSYRYFRTRFVPVAQIADVTVGTGSGYGYDRRCVHVIKHHGNDLKLLALQLPSSDRNNEKLEADAASIRAALQL